MIFDYSRMTRDELQQVVSIVTIGHVLGQMTTDDRREAFMGALMEVEEMTPLDTRQIEDQTTKFLALCRTITADMAPDGPIMKYVQRLQDPENRSGRFDA